MGVSNGASSVGKPVSAKGRLQSEHNMRSPRLRTTFQILIIIVIHHMKRADGIHRNELLQKLAAIHRRGLNPKQLNAHLNWLENHRYINTLQVGVRKVAVSSEEGSKLVAILPDSVTLLSRVRDYYDM